MIEVTWNNSNNKEYQPLDKQRARNHNNNKKKSNKTINKYHITSNMERITNI